MRTALLIAYDGTRYAGWQSQAKGEATLQDVIEHRLKRLCKCNERLVLVGAGRTDAGVHARGMVAHLDLPRSLPMRALTEGLNVLLPTDIRIRDASVVAPDFHARFHARAKTYRYLLRAGSWPDPLRQRYCWFLRRPLDTEALRAQLQVLIGEHDFASFQNSGSDIRSTRRHIQSIEIHEGCEGEVSIQIRGTGFLKQMVRNIVGHAVEYIQGRELPDMRELMERRDRRAGGRAAPAQGLCLEWIDYASAPFGNAIST